MNIADVVATRGNCLRRQVGAVIVKDQRIVSTGYNGTPAGVTNCCDGGCPRCSGDSPSGANLSSCVCLHAEENAITQATVHNISLNNTVLYCTLSPCLTCAKMIIDMGIKEVVYRTEYEFDQQTGNLFSRASVHCKQL